MRPDSAERARPRRAPSPSLDVALARLAAAPPRLTARPYPWRRAYDPALAIKAGYTERWA